MKKTSKKVLSVVLVVMLLCSMLSITAFASPANPEVTVYITRGMFTSGGIDPITYQPVLQHYVGGIPSTSNYFNSVLGVHTISIANIPSMKTYYGNVGSGAYTPNVLDAIAYVLTTTETLDTSDPTGTTYMPVGGWDAYTTPNGGYISSFSPEGGTTYNSGTVYVAPNGSMFYNYTGTGWQVACTQTVGGVTSVREVDYYATQYGLFDGMVIVFDLSTYDIYYPMGA